MRAMFATDGTGWDTFCSEISGEGFNILVTFLRFHNREERKLTNPAAAISDIFEIFIQN